MYHKQHHNAQKASQRHHHMDRPERHTVAELARLDPRNHEANRLSGVLATLDRIARLTSALGA